VVYASIVPRGWERKVKAVTLSRGFVGFGCLMGGVMFRGCFRQVCRSDPDEDRDATWSWSREISVFVMSTNLTGSCLSVFFFRVGSARLERSRALGGRGLHLLVVRAGGGGSWF